MTSVRIEGLRTFVSRLPFYIGGFMGPFGTIVIVPMFPELRETFNASSTAVGLGYSLYLVPFAGLLLVSGTLGERWGRRRTVRGAYLLYAFASFLAVLAPNLGLFIASRALQGVANAFITPMMLSGLAQLVPPERFGRQVGIYSSFQALGGGLGPIIGGMAADSSWRLAYVGTMLISLLLATTPPTGEPRSTSDAPRFRSLLTGDMTRLGLGFLFAAAGPVGISVLVGVLARDVLDLSGTTAGVVLFMGAMSAFAMGPVWGVLLDRFGPLRMGYASVAMATLFAGLPSLSGSGLSLAATWVLVGASVSFVAVVFQALGASIMPHNRGGALSFLLSFRFLGHALGPIVFIPLIDESVRGAFFSAAALGLITLALVASVRASLGGAAQSGAVTRLKSNSQSTEP